MCMQNPDYLVRGMSADLPLSSNIGGFMTSQRTTSTFAVLVAFLALAAPVSAESVMQPGGWEIRVSVTAQTPATGENKKLNETTTKFCLSKTFLDKDPYLKPGLDKDKMEKKNAKCSISDEKVSNKEASWKMVCQMADGSTVDSTITNTASAIELKSVIQQLLKRGTETMTIQITMDGKRIGECTKDMPSP
jgi:hypothetical protein